MHVSKRVKTITAIIGYIIGLVSGILSLSTTPIHGFNLFLAFAILLFILSTITVLTYVIPKENLPDGIDEVVGELEASKGQPTFKIVFPCDATYYRAANKLAKEKFGKNSASTKVVNDWKNRNELLLSCLANKKRVVGYFDILPLKREFAQRLMDGEVGEKDIRAEHILAVHEIKKTEYLYFAGIAVKETDSGKGCMPASYLAFAAVLYLKLFYYNSLCKKILTIPTSSCGLKLAEHMGFTLEQDRQLRKDGYDLYSKEFNIPEISKMITANKRIYSRFDASAYQKALLDLTTT